MQPRQETVVVTGSFEPLELEEVDRAVRQYKVRDWALVSNTIADFLQLDPSVDLRQRAPNGMQGDLSIRGGSFGQTLVLIDGQRVNDAQSGHHNLDLPLPLESIDRVEILRGAGSTLYGADATGGVVNVITARPESSEMRLRTAVGNFGVNQQRGWLSFARGAVAQSLAFSRDFSSGFQTNRDYRNLSLASRTALTSPLGPTDITLAYADRPFGAEQFYGNFNSWEDTRTWLASARQALGHKTQASFTYRRHTDLFVLYRDRPQVFTNRHASESFLGALRRTETLGTNVKLFYGAEGVHESIASNNLGQHSRARGAGYASLDVRALRRFSFSIGAREEVYGSLASQFSPSVSAGVWLSPHWKVRGGVSRAFRVPTYTDLYYQDPGNRGSPDLRPETAWSYEGGLDWNAGGRVRAEATVFQRRERDGIDYIRRSAADIWRAANIHQLHFTGLETGVSIRAARAQQIELRYTGLRGVQSALSDLQSKYVFNYPVHTGIASWMASLPGDITMRTRIGAMERRARDPYAVWDLYFARGGSRVRPFVQFTNLTDTRYQQILGVPMPGRAVVGGLELVVFGRTR
ncbi:MAG: TonB-dependent receptor plug domain-containing protein [Bryobacteraceae bacterium]